MTSGVLAAAIATLAFAQDDNGEPPAKPKVVAPTAKAPAPFTVDRTNSAVEFTLAFQLGDDEKSRLRVHFDGAKESEWQDERCLLALDFEPLEGSRFSWSRIASDAPLESVLLASTPEPKELAFELKVRFPPRRGVEITLADGTPLLVARTPTAPRLDVAIDVSGNVVSANASAPKATSDPRLVDLLTKSADAGSKNVRRGNRDSWPLGVAASGWQLATLTTNALPIVPPAQPIDEVDAPEGTIERVALDVGELMIVPTIVVKPKRDGNAATTPSPAYVIVGGGSHGKSEPNVLAQVAKRAKSGRLVVAVDLLGCGERRELQHYDSLDTPEPRLVGKVAAQYAADELRQVLAWTRRRPDVDSEHVELELDVGSFAAMSAAEAIATEAIPEEDAKETASPELVGASVLGQDNVRSRFDSWLLQQTFEASDGVVVDRSKPLLERLRANAAESALTGATAFSLGSSESDSSTVVCASDFGPAAAVDFALDPNVGVATSKAKVVAIADRPFDLQFLGVSADATWLVLHPDLMDRAEQVVADVRKIVSTETRARRVRLFGEGSCGVVMLLAATLHPDQVESVTALHSIPSFETLLRRPGDVHRAPASLEVLSQGMPSELFVYDALRRFDLEECVLELRSKGVAVDWREPVGALRRPLPRHDRLSMWPRVRHLETKR